MIVHKLNSDAIEAHENCDVIKLSLAANNKTFQVLDTPEDTLNLLYPLLAECTEYEQGERLVIVQYDTHEGPKVGRTMKALCNPKLLWLVARYVRFPALAKLRPFSADFINSHKGFSAPFLEVMLFQGAQQLYFLFHEQEIPSPETINSDSGVSDMLDNLASSRPLWHLLNSVFIQHLDDAYKEHLKPCLSLFGTSFISNDKWNSQYEEYVKEIKVRVEEQWMATAKETWKDHPKELAVISQIPMRLDWILEQQIFNTLDSGISFPGQKLPVLSPMIIIDIVSEVGEIQNTLKWVCIS